MMVAINITIATIFITLSLILFTTSCNYYIKFVLFCKFFLSIILTWASYGLLGDYYDAILEKE